MQEVVQKRDLGQKRGQEVVRILFELLMEQEAAELRGSA